MTILSKKTKKKISKAKRTVKRYLTKAGIRRPRKNPEANINSLIPFKYYILSFDQGYTFPIYKIIIFKDYDEYKRIQLIEWLHPKTFQIGQDEIEEIEKIWGPFKSLDEAIDFGYRLPKGRWL